MSATRKVLFTFQGSSKNLFHILTGISSDSRQGSLNVSEPVLPGWSRRPCHFRTCRGVKEYPSHEEYHL